MAYLFNIIVSFGIAIIDILLGTHGFIPLSPTITNPMQSPTQTQFFGLFTSLYILAVLVPFLSLSIRRLHDLGKSGNWWFINFIPIVGPIVFLIWMFSEGEPTENIYGVPTTTGFEEEQFPQE
jgi:uncharacterized membrane protein YhaH (DUF805 family)